MYSLLVLQRKKKYSIAWLTSEKAGAQRPIAHGPGWQVQILFHTLVLRWNDPISTCHLGRYNETRVGGEGSVVETVITPTEHLKNFLWLVGLNIMAYVI